MWILLAIVGTVAALSALASVFWAGYKLGHLHGARVGYDKAADDLLFIKDPEAWDKARYLKVEQRTQLEQATTKVLKAQQK